MGPPVRARPEAAVPAGTIDPSLEEFLALWAAVLDDFRRVGTVLLVEGERDRASLRSLGVPGPIVLVHRGLRLSSIAHEIEGGARRAIVLTDWDAAGGELARRLRELLEAGPVEVDLETRRRIARVVRGEVVHVEGLYRWARRLAERSGAPLDHFLPTGDGPAAAPTG